MAITERGRLVLSTLDEKGNMVFGGLTETGKSVFSENTDITPTSPPQVIYATLTKSKISDEINANETQLKFKFDSDVTAWEVRVNGSGQGTGVLADSGVSVSLGSEITAIIDWTELYQEGQNRVNIYGQNVIGWTAYEDAEEPSNLVKSGLIGYYHADQGWSSSSWSNISPMNNGNYNATPTGTMTRDETKGIYFNANDFNPANPPITFFETMKNYYTLPVFSGNPSDVFEVEIYFQSPLNPTHTVSMCPFGYSDPVANEVFSCYISPNGSQTQDLDGNSYTINLQENTQYKLNYVADKTTKTEKYYINDTVIFSRTVTSANITDIDTAGHTAIIGAVFYKGYGVTGGLLGYIKSIKIYNRELTTGERSQNTTNGTAVGL